MHKKHAKTPFAGAPMGRLFLFVLIAGLAATADLSAQLQWGKESLTRGRLWSTIGNYFTFGAPVDPWNVYFVMDYPGYSKGANVQDALNYMETAGFAVYGERNSQANAYSLNARFYPAGQYVTPVEEAALIQNYNLSADPTNPSEEMVTGAQHIISLNVDVSHKSMAWSFPKFESFLIHEVTIKNMDSTPLENFYFSMRYGFRITERPLTYDDEKYGWDSETRCFYFHDDKSFRWEDESLVTWNFGVGPERGDLYDARDIQEQGSREHELDSPGYITAICLDSAGAPVHQNIVRYLGQGSVTSEPPEDMNYYFGTDEPAFLLNLLTHEQPRMSWDEARAAGGEGGNKYERQPELYLSCGPLEMSGNSEVTLVFAEVVGEMDRHHIVEGGVANIDLNAVESLAALKENINNCRLLYANGYVPPAYPPPTPTDGENSLTLTPLAGAIQVEWPPIPDGYTDPLLGTNDLAGYRVYRSDYFTIGPWDLVDDIALSEATVVDGNVVFVDTSVKNGVGSYYTVTSYDNAGNESGKVNNNRYPVYPLREANADFPRNVYVVPNPFRQHSRLMGSGERFRMEFIGLPSACTIKVYTTYGDLVKTISHDDGSGSESWGSVEKLDYMLNDWLLGVAPGIYVFHVESQVTGHEGESYIGKFAIIK